MKLLKLFKKRKPHVEFAPDEELVAAIRRSMGDEVADQVRGRLSQREEYDADIAALEEELTDLAQRMQRAKASYAEAYDRVCDYDLRLLEMFSAVGGALPIDACGTFCSNGYPRQVECPYESTEVKDCGHAYCANFCPDLGWEKVLTDRRELLLRKRDNGRLTDEEKDELLRSADAAEKDGEGETE